MLGSIADDIKEEEIRQSFVRVRVLNKQKGEGVFKANAGDNYDVEGQTKFVTPFCDED